MVVSETGGKEGRRRTRARVLILPPGRAVKQADRRPSSVTEREQFNSARNSRKLKSASTKMEKIGKASNHLILQEYHFLQNPISTLETTTAKKGQIKGPGARLQPNATVTHARPPGAAGKRSEWVCLYHTVSPYKCTAKRNPEDYILPSAEVAGPLCPCDSRTFLTGRVGALDPGFAGRLFPAVLPVPVLWDGLFVE